MFGFKLTDYDKRVYEEELRDFLPNNIVDSHTHVYPKSCKKYDEPKYWPDRVAIDNTIEDIVQTYLDMFPDKKVIPVVFGHPECYVDKSNEYCKKVVDKYGYPKLYLTDYPMTEEFLEKEIVEGGFKGLKPYFCNCKSGVSPREAGIYDYLPHSHLRVADKYGLSVVLHISKEERLKNRDNINTLTEIEQKYPNVKLIVAHVGRAYAEEDIGDAFETLKRSEKMMFDFCANTLNLAMEKCIEAVGTKRIMFGSDLPIAKMRMYRIVENGYYINVVPRGMYGDLTGAAHMRESDEQNIGNFMYETIRSFKKCAENLTLSKQDVEAIMCNNAADLYGIKF